jgi:hypothetical protein
MRDTTKQAGCCPPEWASEDAHRKQRFDRQISLYVMAAGATAAGMLAFSQMADAKVVYTSTEVTITASGDNFLFLDVNNDGISDFEVKIHKTSKISTYCFDLEVAGKGPSIVERYGFADRLSYGAEIGQSGRFASNLYMVRSSFGSIICYPNGPWGAFRSSVKGFLGLRFPFRDGVHYGWASFTLPSGNAFSATLTGYAYETVPGKSLKAGQTHNTSSISDSKDVGEMRPLTLGALAAGSRALDVWRREEDATH